MIIEIRYENYRSIKNKTVFDLRAESICEFRDCVLKWNRNKTDEYHVLPMKIILGQHECGKSNLFLGLQTLKELMMSGTLAMPAHTLELAHIDQPKKPISLGITFLCGNKLISYDVSFTPKEVVYESLEVNCCRIFERHHQNIKISKTNKAMEYMDESRASSLEVNEKQCNPYTANALFLTTGLKAFIAPTLVGEIIDYFYRKVFISMKTHELLSQPLHLENRKEIEDLLKEIKMGDILTQKRPLSSGMIRFINLADVIFKAIKQNATVFMDGMVDGLNPTLVMPLLMHLHEKGNSRSQVIFNTHNPVYLEKQFIRRDEITFITRENEITTLKSLLDYANRENNYLRKYLSGDYETIPVVKFKSF